MANQNFRVKRGLEVGANGGIDLYADNSGVGINSIEPRVDLDVRGDGFFETLDIVNPAGVTSTNPALDVVGYSTFKGTVYIDADAQVTGDLTLTDVSLRNLGVSGIATIENLEFNVGLGSTLRLDYLRIDEDIDFNGTGIATIGGDPVFNTLTVLGISTFAGSGGVSTFYDDVNFVQDVVVSAGGSIFTPVLGFNTGFGQTMTLDYLRINEDIDVNGTGIATIGGDPVFNTLEVLNISQLGNPDPVLGFTTVRGDLYVAGDLYVRDDIFKDEISGRNLNVIGIGTIQDLRVPGIASLTNAYIGVGTIGFSTTTDAYIGVLSARLIDAEEIQLDKLDVDEIGVGTIRWQTGLGTELVMTGISTFEGPVFIDNVVAITSSVGIAKTLIVGGDVVVGGGITFEGDINVEIDVNFEVQGNLNVGGIGTIKDLEFNTGIGSYLSVGVLTVREEIEVNGTGVATIGGDPVFNTLTVLGISTFAGVGGVSTFYDDVNITRTLFLGDLDSEGNISAGGTITTNDLRFNTGIGSTLTVTEQFNVVGFASIADLDVSGITTTKLLDVTDRVVNPLTVGSLITIDGNLGGGGLSVGNAVLLADNPTNLPPIPSSLTVDVVNVNQTLSVTGPGTSNISGDLDIQGELDTQDLRFDVGVGNSLSVTGITTTNQLYAVDLFVRDQTILEDLYVNGIASLRGAGIATIFGDAEFNSLVVNPGVSSFVGFVTLTNDLYVAGVSTFEGRMNIVDLNSTGLLNITDLNVAGLSTFVGVGTFKDRLYAKEFVGVASLITFYPAPLVGFGTNPPTTRPNGDPVQFGDTWFDEAGLRQYIYYPNDPTGLATDPQPFWIDANPVAAIPSLNIAGDFNDAGADPPNVAPGAGSVGLGSDPLTISGTPENIVTYVDENVIRVALTDNIRITGDFTVEGQFNTGGTSVGDFLSTGLGSFNNVYISGSLGVTGLSTFVGNVEVTGDGEFTNLGVTSSLTSDHIDAQSIFVAGIGTFQDIDSLSDRRLKENITPVKDPLDKLERIRGVDFTFINSGKKSTGVIAQEVEQVMPHLIHGDFPKSVNYNGLIGLLIESVKDLKAQNEELSRRIEKLEKDK